MKKAFIKQLNIYRLSNLYSWHPLGFIFCDNIHIHSILTGSKSTFQTYLIRKRRKGTPLESSAFQIKVKNVRKKVQLSMGRANYTRKKIFFNSIRNIKVVFVFKLEKYF